MGWPVSRAASIILPIGITVSLIIAVFWVTERFTLEGRLQDRFGSIAMRAPMELELRQPPIDVSSSICPQIDDVLRAELSPRTEIEVGWGFYVRMLIIEVGADRQCSASVHPGLAF